MKTQAAYHNKTHVDRRARGRANSHDETEHGARVSEPPTRNETQEWVPGSEHHAPTRDKTRRGGERESARLEHTHSHETQTWRDYQGPVTNPWITLDRRDTHSSALALLRAVFSPHCSLYTNDCTSKDPSIKLLKLADDTTVIELIQDGDESAYTRLVQTKPGAEHTQNKLLKLADDRHHSHRPHSGRRRVCLHTLVQTKPGAEHAQNRGDDRGLQYILTDCTEDNVQNTHTYTQYTQCTITVSYTLCTHIYTVICEGATDYT